MKTVRVVAAIIIENGKVFAALDQLIQMDDEPFLPVDGCLSTERPSVHSLHDALHEETVFPVPAGRRTHGMGIKLHR